MADCNTEIHINDKGTVIQSTIMKNCSEVFDLSAADTIEYILKKPSGTVVTLTCVLVTDGSDGEIRYTSISSTFDEAGYYKLQAHIVLGSTEWRTNIETFRVYPNLD